MIQYLYTEGSTLAPVKVQLDGKIVGTIKKDADGWRYYPKGQKTGGEAFKSLVECQRSLE